MICEDCAEFEGCCGDEIICKAGVSPAYCDEMNKVKCCPACGIAHNRRDDTCSYECTLALIAEDDAEFYSIYGHRVHHYA